MPELMDDLGLTEKNLMEKHLLPLLAATTIKHFQYEGKVKQECKIPDNRARLRALDMALHLIGAYSPADQESVRRKGPTS